jgi:hypothetical protein
MPSATISKNWILGLRSVEFEATYVLPVGGLSSVIDGCVRLLDSQLAGNEAAREMQDFKGRDPQESLIPGIAAPKTDELLRVGGSIAVAERGGAFEWEPFEAVCYTPFARFEGSHHIVFSVQSERSQALPSWLPIRLLGSAAPIRPTFFRYGLQHFRSRMTFASLGYTPQVTESVLIDSVSDALTIKITCELKRSEPTDPFSKITAFSSLFSVIKNATGHDVMTDYREAVGNAMRGKR